MSMAIKLMGPNDGEYETKMTNLRKKLSDMYSVLRTAC